MSTYETWSTIFSSLSLCCSCIGFMTIIASIGLLYFQTRIQTANHTVSTLNLMEDRWTSGSMLRARLFYCQSWIDGNQVFSSTAEYITEFFEELGIYMKIQALPKKAVWETYSWYCENYYCLFENGIKAKQAADSTLYREFGRLFLTMQKISRQEGAPSSRKNEEELKAFVEREIEITNFSLALKGHLQEHKSKSD